MANKYLKTGTSLMVRVTDILKETSCQFQWQKFKNLSGCPADDYCEPTLTGICDEGTAGGRQTGRTVDRGAPVHRMA